MNLIDQIRDLPERRQAGLVWRVSWSDEYLAELLKRDGSICSRRRTGRLLGMPVAMQGTDGWMHLVLDGQIVCSPSESTRPARKDGRAHHSTWPAKIEKAIPPCPEVRFESRGNLVVWSVATDVDAGLVEPLSVPLQRRCPAAVEWPPSLMLGARRNQLVILRRQLVALTGQHCTTCGVRWATKVDHDHFSGLVRGYLCADCNARVDLCDHTADCAFASYLDDPPAATLGAIHPEHASRMASARYRGRILAYQHLCRQLGREDLAGLAR